MNGKISLKCKVATHNTATMSALSQSTRQRKSSIVTHGRHEHGHGLSDVAMASLTWLHQTRPWLAKVATGGWGSIPGSPSPSIFHIIQCNLDYLDLIYQDPRLSGLAGNKKIHYHAHTEGVANDLFGCGHRLRDELRACSGQSY